MILLDYSILQKRIYFESPEYKSKSTERNHFVKKKNKKKTYLYRGNFDKKKKKKSTSHLLLCENILYNKQY